MNDTYELSWSGQFSQEALLNRLDETVLELDMLKIRFNDLQAEAKLYEKLYQETLKKCWSVGL